MTTLRHHFAPRGGCRTGFIARDNEVLLSGPAGTGKSRAVLEKLNRCALKYPGMRGLILRRTAVSLTWSALVTWRERVIPEAVRAGIITWFGGSQQEAAGYRYANGSVINVGGLDNPTKIMSTDYDIIFIQEAVEVTLTDWESALSRLRHNVMPYQQLIADTNPASPEHFLKKRGDDGTLRLIETRHEDNPLYYDDRGEPTAAGRSYVLGTLERLTGVRYLRLRRGLWVAAEGQIYENWDPAVHIVDPRPIPSDWPRYWSVDFGFRNPFVLQCWAMDPDGQLILYREIYHTQRIVEDHCRTILDIVAPPDPEYVHPQNMPRYAYHGRLPWTEPRPRAIICDHDAEDRATLERHLGLGTIGAKKAVSPGLQLVESRLRTVATEKPQLVIMRNALVERDDSLVAAGLPASTIEEFPSYVWDPRKEAPVKENDHGMDALRYLVLRVNPQHNTSYTLRRLS